MLMSEGEKWEVYIPANLGYGAKGQGEKIPPNSALMFRIEMGRIKGDKFDEAGYIIRAEGNEYKGSWMYDSEGEQISVFMWFARIMGVLLVTCLGGLGVLCCLY